MELCRIQRCRATAEGARYCIIHFLQTYSRVVSRALQLLCAHLHSSGVCLGFPNMVGVRDQVKVVRRLASGADVVSFRERDMDDMFWLIKRSDALRAIQWAVDGARSMCAVNRCRLALHEAWRKASTDLARTPKVLCNSI